MSSGTWSETPWPRPDGRPVVLSTRLDQYGDPAPAPPEVLLARGVVARRTSCTADAQEEFFQPGGNVSSGQLFEYS